MEGSILENKGSGSESGSDSPASELRAEEADDASKENESDDNGSDESDSDDSSNEGSSSSSSDGSCSAQHIVVDPDNVLSSSVAALVDMPPHLLVLYELEVHDKYDEL